MSKLLPCPFCGKRPHLIEPDDGDFNWSVSCLHCVAIDMQDISKEGVIEKWNTRHYPPEVQQAVERMTPKPLKKEWTMECHCGAQVARIQNYCSHCGQRLNILSKPFAKD